MRIKVCLIIPTLVQGGAEKQLALLAANLNPERFDTHVVVLTHTGPIEDEIRRSGVEVHLIGKRFKLDPTSYLRLEGLLRKLKPHVVHTWLFAANSYGRLAAARTKVPVIIAGERCVDPWKTWWHNRIDRWMMRHTTAVATNTQAVTDFYRSKGLPTEKFTVIPNAIAPIKSSITKEELFRRLKIPPRKFVIGAVGRLWPQKGYPALIWASELARVVLKDVWVVVVGDGPQRQRLMELRDHYRSDDALKFVGHRKDASELLTAFDLLWNGSLYEGQSNTILEAMAAGVPAIASDIPGNRDLIVHDQTGYLYPLGDAGQLARYSCSLLADSAKLEQFRQSSRELAIKDFSIEKMVTGYQRLYQELYEKSKKSNADRTS